MILKTVRIPSGQLKLRRRTGSKSNSQARFDRQSGHARAEDIETMATYETFANVLGAEPDNRMKTCDERIDDNGAFDDFYWQCGCIIEVFAGDGSATLKPCGKHTSLSAA